MMIDANEYSTRRNKILDKLENNSLLILFAGQARKKSGDESFPFDINRNFYYLTGIEQENSVLLLVKCDGEISEYLFIDEKNEKIEKWTGIKMTVEEAREISGIETVLMRSTFEGKIEAAFSNNMSHFGQIDQVYLDLEKELKIDECVSTVHYAEELKKKYQTKVIDVNEMILKERMVKSPAEIDCIREAIETTDLGIRNALRVLKPGRYEYNLRNAFEYSIFEEYGTTLAFDTIIASGKNGVILHYPEAKDMLNDGELVLFDLGAAKSHYSADISRTFPINGKYSDLQKKIYEIVLECNKATINFIRPGITLVELNDFAKNFLAEECFAKGLISSKEEITRVYYHSVSHHLGLDTHDGTDRSSALVPGNVVTVEPGLYFAEYNIGIRIEDDVLVTENGREVLSKDVIKEVSDIEKLLRSRNE